MAEANKDTIYIDIDEEITGIIDKVRASSGKIVALVLPKRATVLQSIVNMKLLKRSAEQSKKHLVLITSEAGLLPLAGAVGLHVARTIQSKPEIPAGPQLDDGREEMVEETADMGDEPEFTPAAAAGTPVGQLAGMGAAAAADDVETVELDNSDDAAPGAAGAAAVSPKDFKPPKPKKNSKLHVPNFERFRLLLVIGVLVLILLIGGIIFALTALPKATINVTTNASNVNASLNLALSTTATALDPTTSTVPAKLVQEQKTYTQAAPATGQQNQGQKATGSLTITNCTADNSDVEIPAGTGVSASGLTYITQGDVSLPFSGHRNNGKCDSVNGVSSANVNIASQTGGAKYNASSGTSFSVAGFSSVNAQASSAITGGTDNIVTVVSQSDIDGAKAKITTQNSGQAKQDLQGQLKQADMYAITATFSSGTPAVTSSANVGDPASNVTVTEVVTYTMFGVHQNDLKTLVDNAVKDQIDTSKQSILSEGLDTANFSVSTSTATAAQVGMTTVATAGPDLDTTSLAAEAAGKKSGDIRSEIQSNPGVTGVSVKYSPFWVNSAPKKVSRIKIVIAKPTPASNTSSNASNP